MTKLVCPKCSVEVAELLEDASGITSIKVGGVVSFQFLGACGGCNEPLKFTSNKFTNFRSMSKKDDPLN